MENKPFVFKGEITQEEQAIVLPHLIDLFLHHGPEKILNNKQLGGALKARFFSEKLPYQPRCSERGIRLYIQIIRDQNLIPGLIAFPGQGYMMANRIESVDRYLKVLKQQRAHYDRLIAFAEKHRVHLKSGRPTQTTAF